MTVERKFTALKDLKVSDEGPGTIEGYRSVFGVIDEGGDIVMKGAFKETLGDYLHLGFTAHSHDWSFSEAVGFPVKAYEDDHGWFVESQFHSTDDAQKIRTKAKERMAAGKQVGFSFGYAPKKYLHIEAKDYEAELPKYIKSDLLPTMLKKAQDFNRIRVLKEVEAIEDSIVTAPMNKRAAATDVKSEKKEQPIEEKGMFEDTLAQREESLCFLFDVLCSALYSAQYLDEYGNQIDFDLGAAIDEILAEFSARVRAAFVEDQSDMDMPMQMSNRHGSIDFKGSLRERLPFAKHTEAALGAVEVFAQKYAAFQEILKGYFERSKSIMELREAKAGAVYSSSNLSHMRRIHDAIKKMGKDARAMDSDMEALIAKASKKEEKSDEQPVATAEALRAQSLRLESDALRALSQ